MTIFFPDVSQYTPVSLAGAPVALARATISTVTDTHWQSNVDDAAAHGVPLLAYCFLNAASLGVSPEAQADYAFAVVGDRPTMLDHEPNRNACASLDEAVRFIGRYRSRGGVLHLSYLPRWAWSTWMGSPSLTGLRDTGVSIVSSYYTAYSDTGPGWSAYGGITPVQWQYSSTHPFNGVACDWNAFKGTVDEYLALANGQGESMGTTDNIIAAWAQGNITGIGGEDVEPVKWRIRDEAWQKSVDAALATLASSVTAAPAPILSDAQVAAVSAAVAAAVVGGHDALSAADLAGVQAAADAAVRAVLGGLG